MGIRIPRGPALPPDRPNPIEPKDFSWDDSLEGCRSIVVAVLLGTCVWILIALAFGVF
jgi:hypothetical protein